jgi:hypothetical protein
MQTNTPARISSRWNPWPVSIISFFIVAIVSCVTFVAFCSRHPVDLISANYYEEEIRYQGQIERLQHAQQASQLGSVSYNPITKIITVSLPSDQSEHARSGQVQLYRPSAASRDRQLKLELDPKGLQRIDAASLLPGLWKVRISWAIEDREYFMDEKIVVPSKAS